MKKVVSLLLAMWINSANAYVEWSSTDLGLLLAASALQVVDWNQTRIIAKNPQLYFERNPLLGEHPTTQQVNKHFAISLLALPLLAHYLPEYRSAILAGWLTVEVICVGNNKHIGVGLTF